MDILDILLDILLEPPQPLMGLFFPITFLKSLHAPSKNIKHQEAKPYLFNLAHVELPRHDAQIDVGHGKCGAWECDVGNVTHAPSYV